MYIMRLQMGGSRPSAALIGEKTLWNTETAWGENESNAISQSYFPSIEDWFFGEKKCKMKLKVAKCDTGPGAGCEFPEELRFEAIKCMRN